jgi:hypothetical protein
VNLFDLRSASRIVWLVNPGLFAKSKITFSRRNTTVRSATSKMSRKLCENYIPALGFQRLDQQDDLALLRNAERCRRFIHDDKARASKRDEGNPCM